MRFKKHIFICTNRRPDGHPRGSCAQKGSEELRDKFKRKVAEFGLNNFVRVNGAGCLDACEYGISAVIYPEAIWYGGLGEEDIDEIIRSHILNGKVVERLLIQDEKFRPEEMKSIKVEPIETKKVD